MFYKFDKVKEARIADDIDIALIQADVDKIIADKETYINYWKVLNHCHWQSNVLFCISMFFILIIIFFSIEILYVSILCKLVLCVSMFEFYRYLNGAAKLENDVNELFIDKEMGGLGNYLNILKLQTETIIEINESIPVLELASKSLGNEDTVDFKAIEMKLQLLEGVFFHWKNLEFKIII